MVFRPRTAYKKKLRNRRCNKCNAKLNNKLTRCPKCSCVNVLPGK